MAYQIAIPPTLYAGAGSGARMEDILKKTGAKDVLLFIDGGVRRMGLARTIEDVCRAHASVRVVEDLTPEPAVGDIERVLAEAGGETPDLVVGVGGGSVMDAAKLASLLVGADYTLQDLMRDSSIAKKQARSVMVPTTCGTGSEATCNAIVAIPERETKQGIVSAEMIPDNVILDVDMIMRLPPSIIAATGVDALAHCVECFTSNKATPLSDMYAKEGARLIFRHIRRAFQNADDIEAKEAMMLGAFYGGVAITGSGTTAVHALSYPLGGKYHIAHGVSNAILFAHVMAFNRDACEARLALLSDAVYPERSAESAAARAVRLIDEIAAVVRDTNIPTSLEPFGVAPGDIDFLVEAGSQQTRLLVNNCKPLSLDDIRSIYRKVM